MSKGIWQMKKTILISAILASGASGNVSASLASNAVLDFDDGIFSCIGNYGTAPDNCTYGLAVNDNSGSYFALDTSGDGIFVPAERIAISSAGTGITLGTTQARGEIDQTWSLYNHPGDHYSQGTGPTVVSASGNTASIDMSGWSMWWGDVDAGTDGSIDWGHGVDATVSCSIDCSVGDTFSLDYRAVFPSGAFNNLEYQLHLEGTIAAPVPIPATLWLFGSGLVSLISLIKRRK